jgi:hypothetical protein
MSAVPVNALSTNVAEPGSTSRNAVRSASQNPLLIPDFRLRGNTGQHGTVIRLR